MSSPYIPSANGIVEKKISFLKEYLHKLGNLQPCKLQYLLYRLNNTPSVIHGASSSFVRFFGREGCVPAIPIIHQKFSPADTRRARVKREETQNGVAANKKRSDASIFHIGDKVRVHSPASGRWDMVGYITDVVKGHRSLLSYTVGRRRGTLQTSILYKALCVSPSIWRGGGLYGSYPILTCSAIIIFLRYSAIITSLPWGVQ